jgi:hypothetical protein
VETHHDHAPDAPCPPACPAWAQGALELFALQRRYAEMLEACRSAAGIECVIVAPAAPGVVIPEYLHEEELVRVNLVIGRDTPEVLLDEWGIRAELTFRGRRFDCAFPWPSVLAGILRVPERKRPRFGVIQGGRKD